MNNTITFNPDYPDIFLGIKEKAGTFPNEKTGEEVKFHNFIVSAALREVEEDSNTVSYTGFENLGYVSINGKSTDKSKIKAEDVARVFGLNEVFNCDQFKDFVGRNCEILFDKKGNIKRITFEPLDDKLKK